MKILFLSDSNSIHTIKWVKSLKKMDFDVRIFSFFKPIDDLEIKYNELNIPITSPNLRKNIRNIRQPNLSKLKYLSALPLLKKTLEKFNPDIVHAHYASSYGILGLLSRKKPLILSIWGSDILEFPKKNIINNFILGNVINSATKICSTSKAMKEVIEKKYKRFDVSVVPFGVDTNHFSFNAEPNKKFTVGIIKSIESYNGIECIIKAADIIVNKLNKEIDFFIVGKGSLKKLMEEKVDKLNLNKNFHFTGFINHDIIDRYYKQLNVFVAPSTREGFGVSVLEAASTGIPSITSNVGGLKEVNIHNQTGFVIEPNDPVMLAKYILKLYGDNMLQKKLGLNARRFVKENFCWDKNVDQMIKIYNYFYKR